MESVDENPLLADFIFPPYDVIEPRHVRPAMQCLLIELEAKLVELVRTVEPVWSKLLGVPLKKITDQLGIVWGIVSHLSADEDTPELLAAFEQVQPEKLKFQLRLCQSKPICVALRAIRNSQEWDSMKDAQRRIIQVR